MIGQNKKSTHLLIPIYERLFEEKFFIEDIYLNKAQLLFYLLQENGCNIANYDFNLYSKGIIYSYDLKEDLIREFNKRNEENKKKEIIFTQFAIQKFKEMKDLINKINENVVENNNELFLTLKYMTCFLYLRKYIINSNVNDNVIYKRMEDFNLTDERLKEKAYYILVSFGFI